MLIFHSYMNNYHTYIHLYHLWSYYCFIHSSFPHAHVWKWAFFFFSHSGFFGIQIKFENNLHTMGYDVGIISLHTLFIMVQFKYFAICAFGSEKTGLKKHITPSWLWTTESDFFLVFRQTFLFCSIVTQIGELIWIIGGEIRAILVQQVEEIVSRITRR